MATAIGFGSHNKYCSKTLPQPGRPAYCSLTMFADP
jgi:hypothetical protein